MRDVNQEYGAVLRAQSNTHGANTYGFETFRLLRCASCGHGALSVVHHHAVGSDGRGNPGLAGVLATFYPPPIDKVVLPKGVPPEIEKECREAEVCASVGALRGASALLRSALEKVLKANGYKKGKLQQRIDRAAADGIITAARKRRAHESVRTLGNDILHEDWRSVTAEEYEDSHHYVQRIMEDFYDNRADVEAKLSTKTPDADEPQDEKVDA
jgi:uncharacterized protein DUF4145